MAVRQTLAQYAYGVGDNLIPLAPLPIVANRDPRSSDFAQPGTIWINSSDDTIWMLATITSNSANWQTSPASGVGIFTSVQVTPGDLDVDQGDVNITLGALNVLAGNTTLAGDLTVSGVSTFLGDIDFSSAALIDLTSTLDAAPSILLEANGGTSEQVKLFSNQGTSASSIYLLSDVGGLTLRATGLASADAINLEAVAGGIDMDAALQINIASSRNTADAIVLSASAGGIDILAAGAAGEDIDVVNTAGSVNISAGEAAADAIVISATNAAGGISVAAGTAGISVVATNGVVDIVSGTGAISVSDDAAATAVNVATGAAAKTLVLGSTNTTSTTTIQSGTGGVLVTSTDEVLVDCAGVLELNSSAGVISIGNDAVAQNINVGTGAAARIIEIGNNTGATAIRINGGTAGAGAINIGQTANDVPIIIGNVTGATSVAVNSGTGGIALASTGAGDITANSSDTLLLDAAGVLEINSSAGVIGIGNDAVAQAINVGTGAAARTITMGNVTGATAVNVNSGTGGINLSSAGIFTLDAVADTQASPTAASTIDANVGSVTFTGFTTAAAGTQDFTITNSLVTTSSQVLCTVCNEGANDAQINIRRITRAAGSFVVKVVNDGAAALNGNVTLTFMVLN
jgi:filamentous hemagglutinin